MSNIPGEIATCACGARGSIIERAEPLMVEEVWFTLLHEGGETHTVERYWNGEAFRFKLQVATQGKEEHDISTTSR